MRGIGQIPKAPRDQPPRMAADFKSRIAIIDLAPVAQKVDNAARVVGQF